MTAQIRGKKKDTTTVAGALSQPHLIDIASLDRDDLTALLDRTAFYAAKLADDRHYHSAALKDRTVLTLFFENSTRTRLSFEVAARRLGAAVINFDTATSSLKKGESLMDTVLTLDAMARSDAMIIRHSEYGAPGYIAPRVSCPVINAGDSWRAHPTQALLDAFTIRQAKGKIEGLKIAICGDVGHSRVAASNMRLLTELGAEVRVIAPPVLLPKKWPVEGLAVFDTLEDGIKGCDIIMMLRLQKERMDAGLIGSDQDYFTRFGLTAQRLAIAGPQALVMHPGPINRGVEIAEEVADDPARSLILQQVANGVPTRMAVLDLLLTR